MCSVNADVDEINFYLLLFPCGRVSWKFHLFPGLCIILDILDGTQHYVIILSLSAGEVLLRVV